MSNHSIPFLPRLLSLFYNCNKGGELGKSAQSYLLLPMIIYVAVLEYTSYSCIVQLVHSYSGSTRGEVVHHGMLILSFVECTKWQWRRKPSVGLSLGKSTSLGPAGP